MDSVLSCHIVLVTRVREVVYLYIVDDACSYEAETVLPKHYRIDGSLADEKFAFEVFCLVDEACLLVALRVDVRMIHVSLSIHYLIPFPVDHRAACNGNLEDVRVIGDQ